MTASERSRIAAIFPAFDDNNESRSILKAGVPAPSSENRTEFPCDEHSRVWDMPSLSVSKALMKRSNFSNTQTYQQRRMMPTSILPVPFMPPLVGTLNHFFGQCLSSVAQTLTVTETWRRA